jgi:hypothetical protein
MSEFDPDRYPLEPAHRTLVWGEHSLEAVIAGELDVGDAVEVMGFHLVESGNWVVVKPDGYVRPVAQFEHDTYDTPLDLIADLSAWGALVWTEMDRDERLHCFKEFTEDEELKDDEDYVYLSPSVREGI